MSEDNGPDAVAAEVSWLWESQTRARRRPRPELSLQLIVRAGIELADSEGLAAVAMARIADSLGAGTMSLYRYVPNKTQLVRAMLDTAIGQPPPTIPAAWQTQLRAWAVSLGAMIVAHPWMLPLLNERRAMGPNELAWFESALAVATSAGFTPRMAVQVVFAINSYVRGTAGDRARMSETERDTGVSEDEWRDPYLDALTRVVDEQRYPTLSVALAAGALSRPAYFEYGLDRLLEGITAAVGDTEKS